MSFRVANDIVLNQAPVFFQRVYADNVVSKFWFVRSFSSQHHSKFNANVATEKKSQVRTKECKTRSFICKVNPTFLRSSRHYNCDTAFDVIVSFVNENVHGFNNIWIGRVETRFQIVKFRRLWKRFITKHKVSLCDILVHWSVRYFRNYNLPLIQFRFNCSGGKFVKELSVLSGNSCADALVINSFVNDSIVKWLSSTLFNKIYHRYSRPVHALLCMLEVFWEKLQNFKNFPSKP